MINESQFDRAMRELTSDEREAVGGGGKGFWTTVGDVTAGVIGGAVAGFAVGGPIGAPVGAIAGGIFGYNF